MSALEINGTLIDPTLLTVTDSKLMNPQLLKAERDDQFSESIKESWQNDKNGKKERLEDALWAITFSDDHFSPLTDTVLKRGDQSGTFMLPMLPKGSEAKVPLYSFMRSDDNRQVSKSVRFGLN